MAVLSSAYRGRAERQQACVYLALQNIWRQLNLEFHHSQNKPGVVEKAREIYANLSKKIPGRVMWDDNGNIGKSVIAVRMKWYATYCGC